MYIPNQHTANWAWLSQASKMYMHSLFFCWCLLVCVNWGSYGTSMACDRVLFVLTPRGLFHKCALVFVTLVNLVCSQSLLLWQRLNRSLWSDLPSVHARIVLAVALLQCWRCAEAIILKTAGLPAVLWLCWVEAVSVSCGWTRPLTRIGAQIGGCRLPGGRAGARQTLRFP